MTRLLSTVSLLVGTLVWLWGTSQRPRDERGLSQSTENAILLVGAVGIAGTVITLVGVYVKNHMPK